MSEDKPEYFWTLDDDYQLKRLWPNHSASHIGQVLGRTRSAIIGRINRLKAKGLPLAKIEFRKTAVNGARPKRRRIRIKVIRRARFAPPLAPVPHEAAPAEGLPLLELESWHCRWPIAGDPRNGGVFFCAAERWNGSPYCPHHHGLAYVPQRS